MGKLVFFLVALAAVARTACAAEPEVPPSQAAVRAALRVFYEIAEAETDEARFIGLQRERAVALVELLSEGLSFDNWVLELKGIEPTLRGGYFVRFVDPALSNIRQVRPTYWNGGPGKIGREAAIPLGSPLYDVLKDMKPGMQATISGRFFPNEDGGPLFEAAKTNFRANEAEKAKFRMPYFAVQFTRIEPR